MKKLIIFLIGCWLALGLSAAELPEDLDWQTNNEDPIFASPDAKRGPRLHKCYPVPMGTYQSASFLLLLPEP